jgi:hypothetical protein
VIIPNPPNIEMTRKPIEEQLAQALEAIASIEPANIDLSNFRFIEFLITYTSMAINIPISTEVMFVRMNPVNASSGR